MKKELSLERERWIETIYDRDGFLTYLFVVSIFFLNSVYIYLNYDKHATIARWTSKTVNSFRRRLRDTLVKASMGNETHREIPK